MGVYDRLLDWRNRLLSSGAFQDWAAAFPLTRPIAQRRARALFDLTAGFVYSQALFACVELDVFHALRDGPLSLEQLSRAIDFPVAGTDRLARAAASLELLEYRSDDRIALGGLGAALLGNPSVFAMIKHHAHLYQDLCDPVALLRHRSKDTRLASFWNYETGAHSSAYSDLMAQTQAFISSEILKAYSFAPHQHLMDVGGGAGAFLCAAKKQTPELKVTLCDLPPVAALAKKRFEEEGVSGEVAPCNFLQDPLPEGADIISLVRVLHDHDDSIVRELLSSIRMALPHNGTLLIAEPMAKTPGAEPMGEAYFGFYLWAMGSGRPRSYEEIRSFLHKAGFGTVRSVKSRRPILTRIVAAN